MLTEERPSIKCSLPRVWPLSGYRESGGLGGQFFLKNLQRAGFPGRIYLIHPAACEINGMAAHPGISALPEAVDLIIVCVPVSSVPSVLEESGRKGIRNVHILSSGFKELGTPEGKRLEEELQRQALKNQLNVIGPNCMGPYVPATRWMPGEPSMTRISWVRSWTRSSKTRTSI